MSGPSPDADFDLRVVVLGEFQELSVSHIVGEHFASFDLVDPSMQVEVASHQSGADCRERPQVLQLHQDIFLNGDCQQTIPVEVAVVVTDDAAGRLGVRSPRRDGGKRGDLFGLQQALHRPAVGVTADDNVLEPRAATANSMVAASPPLPAPCGGMMFPALRRLKRSPGWALVSRVGSMRESEQVMKRVSGCCPCANRSNSPCNGRKPSLWN